jgi:hypothetical protein
MAPGDKAWWESYLSRVEQAARDADLRPVPDAGQGVGREAG